MLFNVAGGQSFVNIGHPARKKRPEKVRVDDRPTLTAASKKSTP
jgi:hypothetical protein